MPVIGSTCCNPLPRNWNQASILELQNAILGIAREIPGDSGEIDEKLITAARALSAHIDGEQVFISQPDGSGENEGEIYELYFATGPRYVPELELMDMLGPAFEDASCRCDCPRDVEALDPVINQYCRDELQGRGLIQVEGEQILYDSFAEQCQYVDAFNRALDLWEQDLPGMPLTEEELQDLRAGLIPERTAELTSQLQAQGFSPAQDSQSGTFSSDDLAGLLAGLTAQGAKDLHGEIAYSEMPLEGALAEFAERLDGIRSQYNI